jgi:hypothetical protein
MGGFLKGVLSLGGTVFGAFTGLAPWTLYLIGGLALALPVSFYAGKLTVHVEDAAKASVVGKVEHAVGKQVAKSDGATVKQLRGDVKKLTTERDALQRRIDDHAKATPAPRDPACRIPDGLRDDLNRALRGSGASADGDDAGMPEGDPGEGDDGRQLRPVAGAQPNGIRLPALRSGQEGAH